LKNMVRTKVSLKSSNPFNVFIISQTSKKAQPKELFKPLNQAYREAVNEFGVCLKAIQKNSRVDQEEILLNLNTKINNVSLKLKAIEKTCPKNFSLCLIKFRQEMHDNLFEEFPALPSAVEESFQTFLAILERQKELQPLQKQSISNGSTENIISAQSQLIILKETYERVIKGINMCLNNISKGGGNFSQEMHDLTGFIDSAFVQFRTIKENCPKEFHKEVTQTFERMMNDFDKFKRLIPIKYKKSLQKVFTGFDSILKQMLPQKTSANSLLPLIKKQTASKLPIINEKKLFQELCSILSQACNEVKQLFKGFKPSKEQCKADISFFEKEFFKVKNKVLPIGSTCPKDYASEMRTKVWEHMNTWNSFINTFYSNDSKYWCYLEEYSVSFTFCLCSLYQSI